MVAFLKIPESLKRGVGAKHLSPACTFPQNTIHKTLQHGKSICIRYSNARNLKHSYKHYPVLKCFTFFLIFYRTNHMKAIHCFHGEKTSQLNQWNVLDFPMLRKSSFENLHDLKQTLHSLNVSDTRTPATTQYLFKQNSQKKLSTTICA